MNQKQLERRARARGVTVEEHRATVQATIDEFNSNVAETRKDNPDSREHYNARFPILAEDCDYEISGFSGVQGRRL